LYCEWLDITDGRETTVSGWGLLAPDRVSRRASV